MVTGATSGIGLATARALAQKGASVVVVGRNLDKGQSVVARIRQETGNSAVDLLLADLSIQAQVRRLAQEFEERYPRLDVLVNNAGGSYMKRRVTAEGIELTWALNYLCPFLLTNLLLDTLKASAPSRIINVLSDILRSASIDFDDLQAEKKYSTMRSYGQSKLALLITTYEWARRLEGTQVTVNALHPGFVATEIFAKSGGVARLVAPLIKLMAMSPEEGAETSFYLASSPEVAGVSGEYFHKKQAVSPAPVAYDAEVARRLWEISAEMTGFAGDMVASEPRLIEPVEALHGKFKAGPSLTQDLLAEQEWERSQEEGTGG